jgi:hemolysin activation/secretion protein
MKIFIYLLLLWLGGQTCVAAPLLSTLGEFAFNRFVFVGNTVFSDAQLQALVAPYQQREITAEELQTVRHLITRHYVDAGYINSGAIIPDQAIDNAGNIQIQIIEGHLSQIYVTGVQHLSPQYIVQKLNYSADNILNQQDLQQRLQLLQQLPLVALFNAELTPSSRLGDAVLLLAITEPKRPYELNLSLNNHRSPSIGAYRAELYGVHHSLIGHGDRLQLRLGLTQGLRDESFDYALSLPWGLTWSFFYHHSDADVIGAPFEPLAIASDSHTYGNRLNYAVFSRYQANRYQSLDWAVGLEKRRSRTFLLGQPYDFSASGDEGLTRLSVLSFSQTWQQRAMDKVWSLALHYRIGLDRWGATVNDTAADGRFQSGQLQFNHLQRLPHWGQSQWLARLTWQWSHDALLPLEKWALGGVATVRGYRENQFSYDSGGALSLEWQMPLSSLLAFEKNVAQTLYLAPFVDYGWGKNDSGESQHIHSMGLGLLWSPSDKFNARVYWAKAGKAVTIDEAHDLQDQGWHVELNLHY